MDGEVAGLVDGGVAALSGLLLTDMYECVVRPRVAALLRGGRSSVQLPDIEDFDRLRHELSGAIARGDARKQRVLARELRGYVRSLIDADPVAVAELLSSVRHAPETEPDGRSASVSLVNNTIIGPVLGSGVQHNSL
ncbi:hypothetical protein B7C62_26610 [Kitasatospora albolonga]|uniref:Uncharacterized protein n=1 Tax=Kitasatospora albolonga TaxID=68173 RepID=A0ABC8C0B9_9ACTN|nr:hypothetical protein B7C62_26610 [Kitasatospora albolonga]